MTKLPASYPEPLPPVFCPASAPLPFSRVDFGSDFHWGAAAYQTEGAWQHQGKGPSIWDDFTRRKGAIWRNEHGRVAADFYHRFETDLDLAVGIGLTDSILTSGACRTTPGRW